MRYLAESEPVRLYAETEQRIHTDHEDLFNGIMKFANGIIGILDINWLTPQKRRTLTVTGERGMYVADYINQDLLFFANPDAESTWENRGADGVHGTDHVRRRGGDDATRDSQAGAAGRRAGGVRATRCATDGPPPVDPRDAMIALLLARKMVEAGESGAVISGEALQEALA